MTDHLTEEDVLAAIPGLTRTRLVAFIETELVIPLRQENEGVTGHLFREVDVARVQLLCDLSFDLDFDETALGVVLTLIDQLHATRRDLLAITRAVEAEPPEVRARIGSALLRSGR
jgi:chaperone modulatory protein CbpM